ncbi:MAG: hypothetical protein GY795_28555 [Desulfobacterales bacterium]|nr:hypothetical protein [Desulfobacterales bacterium]
MDIDNEKFKLLLKSYGNADQYFFPHEISSWKDAKDGKEYGVGFVIRRSVDD